MSPSFFIGLTPPPDFAARVLRWQAELHHAVTAPHVTVLAPAAGPPERWQSVAAAVAPRHSPITVRLGGPNFFGSRVIFLKVDAPGLRRVHTDLVAALGEEPGEFALENYHPHLTLALAWRPMNTAWETAVAAAQREFGELDGQPLTFLARELVLFGKAEAGQPYTERGCFSLGGTS